MYKKRFLSAVLGMSLLVTQVSVMAQAVSVNEVEQATQIVMDQKEEKGLYLVQKGEITEIDTTKHGTRILVGDYNNGIFFNLQPKVPVLDANTLSFKSQKDLKEGMEVTVIYPKNSPMALSQPPMSSSAVLVIINSPKNSIEVGYFDENLVNEANTLKLNIGENTVIKNIKGECRVFTADDIKNKNAAVIYDVTTRSIPAQTTPLFVMILDDEKVASGELINENSERETEVTADYKVLREIATDLEYEINWDNENKQVTLTKGELEVTFKIGESTCSINNQVKILQQVNKLQAGSILVSEETAHLLK